MKKTRILTVAIATAIILTGCTSGMKYDKAMKHMENGEYVEGIRIYEGLNDEDKVKFNGIMEQYIETAFENSDYDEIDNYYSAMSGELKNGVKADVKENFQNRIDALIEGKNHENIMEFIEKTNDSIKDLSETDDKYIKDNTMFMEVKSAMNEVFESKDLMVYDKAIDKMENISDDYSKKSEAVKIKERIIEKKAEMAEILYNEIVDKASKYMAEKDFEEAYEELNSVKKITPTKSEEAAKQKEVWKVEEAQYIKELKETAKSKVTKIGEHEESGTSFYKGKGSADGIMIGEFYFDLTVNLVNGRSSHTYLTTHCPSDYNINANQLDFIADGEKCELLDMNFDFESIDHGYTWDQSVSKSVLDEELAELKKFAKAKEAKLVFIGDNKKEVVISEKEKHILLNCIEFYEIFKKY